MVEPIITGTKLVADAQAALNAGGVKSVLEKLAKDDFYQPLAGYEGHGPLPLQPENGMPSQQIPPGIAYIPKIAVGALRFPWPDLSVPGLGGINIATVPMPNGDFIQLFLLRSLKMAGINMGCSLAQGEDPAVEHAVIAAATMALPPIDGSGTSLSAAAPSAALNRTEVSAPASSSQPTPVLVNTRELGELKVSDNGSVRRAAIETYLDNRFGNWNDFTESVKAGHPDFKAFMLAMCDALDVATLGVLRPIFLKVTVNPHLKERMVVYQSELKVEEAKLPDKEDSLPKLSDGVKPVVGASVERRYTQCTRFDIDLSPEVLKSFGMDFSQFADSVISAGLADKTVVYSSLDEKEIRYAVGTVKDGTQKAESVRLRRVEGRADLMIRPVTADEYVKSEGTLVVDRSLNRLISNKVYETDAAPQTTVEIQKPEHKVSFGRQKDKKTEITRAEHTKKELIEEQSEWKDNLTGQISAVNAEGKVITTVTMQTTTSLIDRTHYVLFGWDAGSLLGANTEVVSKTDTQETVKTATLNSITGEADHPIINEGQPLSEETRETKGEEVKSSVYDDGFITYIPGGRIANLGLKSGLGASLNWQDYTAAAIEGVLIAGGVTAMLAKGGSTVTVAGKVVGGAKLAKKATSTAGAAKTISGTIKSVPKHGAKFHPVPKETATAFSPRRIPVSDGVWSGKPGNSLWRPDPTAVPRLNNPAGKTMGEIMNQAGLKDGGVPFIRNRVNFGDAAVNGRNSLVNHFKGQGLQVPDIPVTKTIHGFSADRNNNFRLFDRLLERDLKLPEGSITGDLFRKLNLTRHELPGGRMQLIPTDLHSSIPHSGGVAEFKFLTSPSL